MVEVDNMQLNERAQMLYDMYRPEDETARKNWRMYCISYGDFSDMFSITAASVKCGEAVYELLIRKDMINRLGLVYGGIVYSLADFTAGAANISAGGYGPTLNGSIDYIGRTSLTEKLVCKAKLNKMGKSVSFCEANVYNDSDVLVSKCHFIFGKVHDVT